MAGQPEPEAFVKMYGRLCDCLNAETIIAQCYAKNLLTDIEFSNARAAGSNHKQVLIILEGVQKSIRMRNGNLDTFLSILRSKNYGQLADELGWVY